MSSPRWSIPSRSLGWVVLAVSATLLPFPAALHAADPVFDARGFDPNREYVSQLPFEHADPMTGNLLLTFTDLVLPGNAGFELKIQRAYNRLISSSTRPEAYLVATVTGSVGVPNRTGFFDLSWCALLKHGSLRAAPMTRPEQELGPKVDKRSVESSGRDGRRIRVTW